MFNLRWTGNQAALSEETWLVGGRFVIFITERGHIEAISRVEHGGDALLGAHRLGHLNFFLSLTVMHDVGLLADRHVLVRCKRLLALLRMTAFWSRFVILAKSWIQIFDARRFLGPRGFLVGAITDGRLPLVLDRALWGVMLASACREEWMGLVWVGLRCCDVALVRREFGRSRTSPLLLPELGLTRLLEDSWSHFDQ